MSDNKLIFTFIIYKDLVAKYAKYLACEVTVNVISLSLSRYIYIK